MGEYIEKLKEKKREAQKLAVYMAGSMRRGEDWRGLGITDRERGICANNEATIETWRAAAYEDKDFIYVGPFATSCDHGCAHGSAHMAFSCSDEDTPRSKLFAACVDAISRCDIFAAYINRPQLFGTFAEIGIAKAMGKKIWIGIDPQILHFKTIEHMRSRDPVMLYSHDHDMWFLATIADYVFYGHHLDAVRVLRRYICGQSEMEMF
jgi:nucleoside 2-deoxyribosyltransferase